MPRYRDNLPQLGDAMFLSDGGLETTLIYLEGLTLPNFMAWPLVDTEEGVAAMRSYFANYTDLARRFGAGLILETPTWRANPDWAEALGYNTAALMEANRKSVELLEAIRDEHDGDEALVISGCMGPRRDGYLPIGAMTAKQAEAYHREQVETFADTEVDMVCAMTLPYVEEAIGVARAAQLADMPVVISFTVETDGRLPTGQPLGEAIEQVDDATSGYPSYYMVNCAHPSHFAHVLEKGGSWLRRLGGMRPNASPKSHAQLDESPDLDRGDPAGLGRQCAAIKRLLPSLAVLGGCCGTDHEHIEQIAAACAPLFNRHNRSTAEPVAQSDERINV